MNKNKELRNASRKRPINTEDVRRRLLRHVTKHSMNVSRGLPTSIRGVGTSTVRNTTSRTTAPCLTMLPVCYNKDLASGEMNAFVFIHNSLIKNKELDIISNSLNLFGCGDRI
jgi:hypothetical protein